MVGLRYAAELPPVVRRELEQLVVQLQSVLDNSASSSDVSATLASLQAQINANAASISSVNASAEHTANKGIANGYAGLGADAKVSKAQGGYRDSWVMARVMLRV